MAEGHRPGVMLYLEFKKSLETLTDQNKGKLFQAIMDYAESGKEPKFGGRLETLWPVVKQRLDVDKDNYDQVCEKRRDASTYRWWRRYAEKHGIDPEDKEAMANWMKEKSGQESKTDAKNANASFAFQTMPTTTPPPTPPPTPPSSPTETVTLTTTTTTTTRPSVVGAPSVPSPACAGETPTHTQTEKEWYGEYGNVRLSPAEVNALRRELGDGWEGMVNRLSEYMRMHGKSYSDHYAAVRSFARNSRNTTEKERETLSDKSDQYTDCFPGSVL